MLDKKYNHKLVEEGKYKSWVDKKAFEAGDKKKFIDFFRGGNLNSENIWDTVLEDAIEEKNI